MRIAQVVVPSGTMSFFTVSLVSSANAISAVHGAFKSTIHQFHNRNSVQYR